MNNDRYKRQVVLPEIGVEGQKKLSQASVLCIGAGGLGSPALLYLAAAGMGKIGIADFDTVDESNLQRQVLYAAQDVGQPKAVQAKKRLQALNPAIDIEIFEDGLHGRNVQNLFPSYDFILDGTDNFETRYLINDAAVKYAKTWVYGAVQGFYGQVSVFGASHETPCYRCLYPEIPKARIANCAESGVIGAVVGLIGVTQALQLIQIITQHESFEPLVGKLWTLDTKTMQTRILTVPKNPSCPVCSKPPKAIILTYKTPVCGIIPEVTVAQIYDKSGLCLIDVREQDEWDRAHIEGAQHFPLSKIMDGCFPDIAHDADIILHCQKGSRSLKAAQIMAQNGFSKISNLSGGYEAWVNHAPAS